MVQELSVQNFLPKIESAPAINVEQNYENNGSDSSINNTEKMNTEIGDENLSTTNLPSAAVYKPVVDDGVVDVNTTNVANSNPLVASDDDLIEKEWVEKAKKIVSDTHDDPYAQDEAINKLQADYIDKRYGRKLGSF
jgi:hypothetical protein